MKTTVSALYDNRTDAANAVTNGGRGICEDPAYSPDGNFIVFRSNAPGNYEIYRLNSNGSGLTRLTNAAGTDEYPVYSADGSKIVFTSDRDGNQELYKMNSDGSDQQRLTNNSVRDTEAAVLARWDQDRFLASIRDGWQSASDLCDERGWD